MNVKTRIKHKPKEIFPSQIFGLHIGMPKLFVEWKLPGNKTADECAAELLPWAWSKGKHKEKYKPQLHQFYKELIELNPDLYRIEATTDEHIYDVCFGAISKFNLEDIEFYSLLPINKLLEYNKGNFPIKDEIEKKHGKYPGWILCPSNFQKVLDALGMKA